MHPYDGLAANKEEGGQSTLRISANPNAAEIATVTLKANSSITKLTDGSPASFEVVGAAPNTELKVSVFQSDGTTPIASGTPLILGDPSAGGSDHVFALENFNFWYLTHDNNFTSDTDANGNLDFNVGGTLSTSNYQDAGGAVSAPYQDASYTAQFIVRVDY